MKRAETNGIALMEQSLLAFARRLGGVQEGPLACGQDPVPWPEPGLAVRDGAGVCLSLTGSPTHSARRVLKVVLPVVSPLVARLACFC